MTCDTYYGRWQGAKTYIEFFGMNTNMNDNVFGYFTLHMLSIAVEIQ